MLERKPINVLEWMGFKRQLDLSDAKWLGLVVGLLLIFFGLAFALAVLLLFIIFLAVMFQPDALTGASDGSAIRNVGLVLAAFIGAPFVVWRSIVAAKQVKISEESLFNDKFDLAAQALTSTKEVTTLAESESKQVVLRQVEDDLVARVAAIDRLEALAKEREDAALRVVQLLSGYIRGAFPAENLNFQDWPFLIPSPRIDLQKAVDSLGRVWLVAWKQNAPVSKIDLSHVNFDGVSFKDGFFRNMNFSNSRLIGSNLFGANFENCLFYATLFNCAGIGSTNLRGAIFNGAVYEESGYFNQGFQMSDLVGAQFINCKFSAVDYMGEPSELREIFVTSDTEFSGALAQLVEENADWKKASLLVRLDRSKTDPEQKLIQKFDDLGTIYWSPYIAHDAVSWHLRQRFLDRAGIENMPTY